MSIRVDTSSLIAGALVCGNRGLGVLGADIPSDGDNGAGYAYNDLTLPADAGKEICGRITTWPSAGELYAYEDTSFEFTGPDGAHTFAYQLYVDGVATGSPETVYLQVGSPVAGFDVATDAAIFDGSAHSAAAAGFAVSTAPAVFAGSAQSATASNAGFSVETAAAGFAGTAQSLPSSTASFSVAADSATFAGAAAGAVGATTLTSADLAAIDALIAARLNDIAAAVLAAAQTAGGIHSDMRKAVGQLYHGDGSEANKLRSTLIP